MPNDAIQRINSEVNAVLKDPEVAKIFAQQGAAPTGGTPADLGAYIKKDIDLWRRVIREAGIKVEG